MSESRRPEASVAPSALLTYRQAVLRSRQMVLAELARIESDLEWVDRMLARSDQPAEPKS